MAGATFDHIWAPRIGAEATKQLQRSAGFALVALPAMYGLAIASSFLLGSGRIALGVVAIVLTMTLFVAWIRTRIKLAAAVSDWYGVKIGWQELPRMRSGAKFDEWCSHRGLNR